MWKIGNFRNSNIIKISSEKFRVSIRHLSWRIWNIGPLSWTKQTQMWTLTFTLSTWVIEGCGSLSGTGGVTQADWFIVLPQWEELATTGGCRSRGPQTEQVRVAVSVLQRLLLLPYYEGVETGLGGGQGLSRSSTILVESWVCGSCQLVHRVQSSLQ